MASIEPSVQELLDSPFGKRNCFTADFFPTPSQLDQWKILSDAYSAYLDAGSAAPATARALPGIPRRIHQIWIGGALPSKYRAWAKTWRRFNPGWEYTLWDEERILGFGLRNEAAFRGSLSYGVKSDIARYEILERLGGVYADTDFECLASFETLHRQCSFYVGTIFNQAPEIANGIMGSTPGHPILKSLIKACAEPVVSMDGMEILEKTGPRLLTRAILEDLQRLGSVGTVVFPSSYFYPLPNFRMGEAKNPRSAKRFVEGHSLAIHYWEASWLHRSLMQRGAAKIRRLLEAFKTRSTD